MADRNKILPIPIDNFDNKKQEKKLFCQQAGVLIELQGQLSINVRRFTEPMESPNTTNCRLTQKDLPDGP